MRIDSGVLRDVPVLFVHGDVDHDSAPRLLRAAQEVLDSSCPRIIVDLSACGYLDSGGIGALLSVLRQVKHGIGWLGIVGASGGVRRLLDIVALTSDPDVRSFEDLAAAEEQI